MRGTIGRTFSNPTNHYLTSLTKRTSFLFQSSSPFSASSSSGDGRGRGRGLGGASPSGTFGGFTPALGKPDSEDTKRDSAESQAVGLGHGRGRGIPFSSEPIIPSFSSFVSQNGSGRGRVTNESLRQTPPPPPPPREAKQPIFVMKQDEIETDSSAKLPAESVQSSERTLSPSTPSVASLSGAGRGKPVKQPEPPPSPRLSKEEAVKKAMGILSRKSESDEREDMELRDELYLGNNADGERLAETIGADSMNKLVEGFEEMSSRVLPSPMDDAYLEALHTNFMIEFEPEYLMEEFGTNPDIDEKPPMSLRDALEKVKPFLMSYDGIENQEEWEEAIKETMDKVPLLQEIIDYYSGPDRVTAKKQQEELERVAKTIPKSAPASVKQFANRAVLTLQSNPGWGFDKKCQFMDKLVWEVSQQYK
ncbi:hypothetical protein GOBAR_DD16101 [Gossypium barbadense]|nr:hypothetical protein GOBAR_DD16101 [Gossypium barbadense]